MGSKSKKKVSAASDANPASKRKTDPDVAPISKRTRGATKRENDESRQRQNNAAADESKEPENGTTQKKENGAKSERAASAPSRGKKATMSKASHESKNGESAVSPGGRDAAPPSNMLEKGIIYFFFRGRVRDKPEDGDTNEEAPKSAGDVARSHIVLRPIEANASLKEGAPIGDAGNARLLVLPKKKLPLTGRDRFMAMVEKGGTDFATLRDTFLKGGDHETKTRGTRHAPAAAPLAEGVYAIISTGRATHLAYIVTLPRELGEVQRAMGLKERGSFVVSTKNPSNNDGPPNARFAEKPEYPKEIMDEFGSLRWLPSQPRHLDFANTQLLLIGASSGLEKATAPQKKKSGDAGGSGEEEEPWEELEELEDEDARRVEHLADGESGAIFADLQVHAEDYPRLKTTF